jgi:ubiquinone/menaquinone biosynthesis C-methylase UbiE
MKYNNSLHWKNIHQQYPGQLRAVGFPKFCEAFNELKYASEAETVLDVFCQLQGNFNGKPKLSIMDIGAGTGYWTGLVSQWFAQRQLSSEMWALDISLDALQVIKTRYPNVNILQHDLKTVDTKLYAETFDLVTAFYCLHHLVNTDDFLNGLRFAARSVKTRGSLMIMDPILAQPFSKFDTFDFAGYEGNGIPRHLYLLDDVLFKEGLKRQVVRPAVSFLLNGNIEGTGRLNYAFCQAIWKQSRKVYRSEYLTRRLANVLTKLDQFFKDKNLAFSASLCVYQRL